MHTPPLGYSEGIITAIKSASNEVESERPTPRCGGSLALKAPVNLANDILS